MKINAMRIASPYMLPSHAAMPWEECHSIIFQKSYLLNHRWLGKLSVYLLIFGTLAFGAVNRVNAQNCTQGTGYYTGVICCDVTNGITCQGCSGFNVHTTNTGSFYLRQKSPCDCLYESGGCTEPSNALLSSRETPAERYQSRPMLFLSCNGSILWVSPARGGAHAHPA